jgi:hypothetical protein
MNAQYRHSQPGYLIIIIGLIILVATVFVYAFGQQPLGGILGAIGIFLFAFGYKLTIEISGGYLRFWFGLWLFWKNIPLDTISYCEPYKGVIFGWGIHWGPSGWLYNVSGMKAVTVVLKSGKKIFIGTDEPIQLIEAINSAIGIKGSGETSSVWTEVKADYLKRVEQALSAARHPKSFEILAEVGNHLDRRFAELAPQEQTWESFQKIVTEMGPPTEYAELVGSEGVAGKADLSPKFVAMFILIVVIVTAGMIFLPKILKRNVNPPTVQTGSQTQNEQATTAAIEAAEAWLKLVDEGQYGESWSQAAEYFKKFVNEEQWKTSVEAARKPLGKVLSRKVLNSTYTTTVPGAPDGQYVIIQFETLFENKQSAVETVTPMTESDGQWRVSGYYIK